MVKISWTEVSVADMQEIFEYIAQDSKRYATITVNKFYNRVQLLVSNPATGRIVPEIGKNDIRELIEGNFRIIYRIKTKEEIDILRIYHVARLLKRKEL